MFEHRVDSELSLVFPQPHLAEELFALIETNRTFLRRWLQWLDQTTTIEDTKAFLTSAAEQAAHEDGLQCAIMSNNRLVGMVGFPCIMKFTMTGHIGYWLDEAANGQGIMTKCVREIIAIGFSQLHLKKVEIHCHVDNVRSRAIPERLSLKQEGILRQAGNLYGTLVDHVVYGMIMSEWDPAVSQ
jgi:ribosomal-protein-serine acetyltransferase